MHVARTARFSPLVAQVTTGVELCVPPAGWTPAGQAPAVSPVGWPCEDGSGGFLDGPCPVFLQKQEGLFSSVLSANQVKLLEVKLTKEWGACNRCSQSLSLSDLCTRSLQTFCSGFPVLVPGAAAAPVPAILCPLVSLSNLEAAL